MAAALAGCAGRPTPTSQPRADATALAPATDQPYGYTHVRPDGNRAVAGRGAVPDADPVEFSLGGRPAWLAALPLEAGSLWAAVRDDGRVAAFRVAATRSGYPTHALGSRNLDGALAGDFDGDGRTELLAPADGRDELHAIRRTADGVAVGWSLSLGGRLSTNLAGVRTPDGVAVGAGTGDGTVRVWGG